MDEALSLWDRSISRLANEYLGPEIRSELATEAGFAEGCRNVAMLATVMGQRDVAVALMRAQATEDQGKDGLVARGMERGALHWCAQVLSLPGWERLFFDPCDADDLGLELTSEILSFPVTQYFIAGSDATRDSYWSSDQVTSMRYLLQDMAKMAAYRFWPAYNDLGLSAQDFEDELVADAGLLRRVLGLSSALPVFEVDERVDLPDGFKGLLPYRRMERTSLARRRAVGKLPPAEVSGASVPAGPYGSARHEAWLEQERQRNL
ncbi:hypothetical protein [Dermacoccus barathri]|uniref:hypothetical protein n=1 Tax=Dermacoccus barathri TaxID=322601 RepID=UPI001879C850|nr:hypothetical protein [Dermacoccus barathri]MBE7370891.1 hypothetical protein [Dermacoccus barathri]